MYSIIREMSIRSLLVVSFVALILLIIIKQIDWSKFDWWGSDTIEQSDSEVNTSQTNDGTNSVSVSESAQSDDEVQQAESTQSNTHTEQDDSYKIQSDSGKCMEDVDGEVTFKTCESKDTQKWKFIFQEPYDETGKKRKTKIRNKATGKCIFKDSEVYLGPSTWNLTAEGTTLSTHNCDSEHKGDNRNSDWYIRKVPSTQFGTKYRMNPFTAPNSCVLNTCVTGNPTGNGPVVDWISSFFSDNPVDNVCDNSESEFDITGLNLTGNAIH